MLTGTCDNYTVPSSSPAVSFHLVQERHSRQTATATSQTQAVIGHQMWKPCTFKAALIASECRGNHVLHWLSKGTYRLIIAQMVSSFKKNPKMFIVVSGHENNFKLQRSSIYCFFNYVNVSENP